MFRKLTGALLVAVCLSMCPPAMVFAADAVQVTQMIEALPEKEDITEYDADAIKKAMEEYRSLSMSEKLNVPNYDKLEEVYEKAKKAGYLESEVPQEQRDAEDAMREQAGMRESSEVETGTMEYVFAVSDSSPAISVVVHYITDLDGDGMGDMPSRIVLTSPEGVTTPLSNGSSGLKDEKMDIALTWEPNFMQLDVAYAVNGKWKITTSDPVTFRAMPYAGVRKDITPEDDKEKADAGVTDQEEENSGSKAKNIVLIIFLCGVLVFLGKKYIFKKPDDPEAAAKQKKPKPIQDDVPKRMTDEEVAEQMRREYMEKKARDEENDYDDDYEDLEDEQDDFDDMELEEYEEGDTGILRKEDATAQEAPEEEEEDPGDDDSEYSEDENPEFLADDAFDI